MFCQYHISRLIIYYLVPRSIVHIKPCMQGHREAPGRTPTPASPPGETITNEQGTCDPEAIKKYHYNVAEVQLELHRQNMEWCIGTIAKARNSTATSRQSSTSDQT